MVTAKDELRTLLGKGLDFSAGTAIAFSSEKADKATMADNGIENVLEFVGMKLPEGSIRRICRNSCSQPV